MRCYSWTVCYCFSGGRLLLHPHDCTSSCRRNRNLSKPDMTAACGFLLSGLPGHALFASFLTSKQSLPVQAMSSCRAGSSLPQRQSFACLVGVLSRKQKERASQEQRCSKNDGEISCIAYRCNNPQLRQRTFGKKPPLCLSDEGRSGGRPSSETYVCPHIFSC